MFNDKYFRVITIVVSLVGVICRVAQMYQGLSMVNDPTIGIFKIIGILICVWFVLTPSDLLQSEDR